MGLRLSPSFPAGPWKEPETGFRVLGSYLHPHSLFVLEIVVPPAWPTREAILLRQYKTMWAWGGELGIVGDQSQWGSTRHRLGPPVNAFVRFAPDLRLQGWWRCSRLDGFPNCNGGQTQVLTPFGETVQT